MNAIKITESACCPQSVMLLADGELEPARAVEVDNHVKACDGCRAELDMIRAMRASLRASCTRRAPSAMEERMRLALVASENKAVDQTSGPRVARALPAEPKRSVFENRTWVVGAVAFAACFVVVVVMLQREDGRSKLTAAIESGAPANDVVPTFDTMLDQLVALHANPLPPEEKNPEELSRLEPFVGVPVKRSALSLLENHDQGAMASFDGARLHTVRDSQNAAALQYKLKGHRLTVYVFNSALIPVTRTKLRPRVVHQSPVYVGTMRGYSVVATERAGVGYALASDLDEDKNVQMVASF